MAKTISSMHARVTADATQFVSEFQRADNVSRRHSSNIDREISRLSKSISSKFSAVDIGKSVLSGLGFGSGFAVVNTVADKVVAAWRESAEYAKQLEDRAKSISDLMQDVSKKRRESWIEALLPEQQLEERKKELKILTDQLAAWEETRQKALKALAWIDPEGKGDVSNFGTRVREYAGEKFGGDTGLGGRDFYQLMQERADAAQEAASKIQEAQNDLGDKIKKLDVDIAKSGVKSAKERQDAFTKALDAIYKADQEKWDLQAEALNDSLRNEQRLDAIADKYRELADPVREYRKQLEEIEMIQKRSRPEERLSAAEYAKAVEKINDAIFAARFGKESERPFDPDFKEVTSAAKEMEQELNAMWNSVSDRAGQAFADMVLTGEAAFSDLANIVARAVVEMAARMAIINPLLNGIFGLSGSNILPALWNVPGSPAAIAGAKADGGPVLSGSTYLVGEEGPELFTPSFNGNIIPNDQLRRGGNTYIIDARGTDESVVQRLQAALIALAGPGVVERRALTAVTDARRRTAMA